jgi:hypothetical protein
MHIDAYINMSYIIQNNTPWDSVIEQVD